MTRRLVLALDTSFGPVSTALLSTTGEVLGHETIQNAAGQQAELLPPLVARLFRVCKASFDELARVVVATGPGAFTGVRVGIAFAKGLHIATGADIVGMTSLDCLAAQARIQHPGSRVAVLIDAKRSEAYCVVTDAVGWQLLAPSLLAVNALATVLGPLSQGGLILLGSGRQLVELANARLAEPDIQTIDVVSLGRFGLNLAPDAHPAVPAYLRAPDARLPA